MKYMVLVMVGFVFLGVILYSEYTFEDPNFRAEQRRIAEQTLVVVGTQESTMMALQATVEAAIPIQTQYVAVMREQDLLLGTQDAILNGTLMSPPTATAPPARNTTRMSDTTTTSNINNNDYADTTTASGINDAGCATGRTTTFTFDSPTDGPSVYVVTRARNVSPGTTFQTRWYPTDDPMQPYESISWTADAAYPETCVYFWMEPTDITYSSGSWTVELIVNNVAVQSQTFTLCMTGESC